MAPAPRQIGRYAMHGALASGGMATVHLGRLAGAAGFSRTVAIKSLRPQYAEDADFVAMFIDEARLAARIRHPNVVPTLDVVSSKNELFTVMEYVHGETLSRLIRLSSGKPVPLAVASAILRDTLHGLHAAHESTDENGRPLGVVHRDVSPQNVIVGADGVARVLDFGVAKAAGRIQTTREGQLKGKLAYMAPEQFRGEASRFTDVFAASIVLWETLVGQKLFVGNEAEIVGKILGSGGIDRPRAKRSDVTAELDDVVMRGLERSPSDRFATALEMAEALVRAQPPASTAEVGAWVSSLAADALAERTRLIRDMETEAPGPSTTEPPPSPDAATATDLTRDASRPGPKRRAVWLGVAASVALGLGIASVALLRSRHEPAASSPPPPTASPAAPTSTPMDVSTIVAVPPPTSRASAPATPPASGAPGTPASPAAAKPRVRHEVRRPPRAPEAATHAPATPDHI